MIKLLFSSTYLAQHAFVLLTKSKHEQKMLRVFANYDLSSDVVQHVRARSFSKQLEIKDFFVLFLQPSLLLEITQ